MTIRVAVADDQAIIRSGLRVQISLAPDLEFVGEASNGEQAVAVARQQRPDVLLMDVRMPVLDGIDATRRIAGEEATHAVRVIVLTTFDLDDYVYRALRAGASGFLLKDTSRSSCSPRSGSSRTAAPCSIRR
jgi:DNA-binding NarL/FixJ family response regulator